MSYIVAFVKFKKSSRSLYPFGCTRDDLVPGDEVIVPALTFIAPVNSVAYNGANPVFMDVDSIGNIDAEKTIEFIKQETVFRNGCSHNKVTNRKISAIIFLSL